MDEKKLSKSTVTVRMEFEDGTGCIKEFFMDAFKMDESKAEDPSRMTLKIEGTFSGASNTPIKAGELLDHRNFTF
jgi:hypothetical protein